MADLMTKPINYEVNGEQVNLSGQMVRDYLTSGNGKVSDQEVVMFIQLCRYQKLNPFLHEAYLVKFGSSPAQIITSKEAFMKRAENNVHYRGYKAGIIIERNNEIIYQKGAFSLSSDKLVGGWAEVMRDDRDENIRVEIGLDEFSKSQSTWKSMPKTMIRKTALVNALREAFPETLGALYTEDDKDLNEARQPRSINAKEDSKQAQSIDDLIEQDTEPEIKEAQPVQDENTVIDPEEIAKGIDEDAKADPSNLFEHQADQ